MDTEDILRGRKKEKISQKDKWKSKSRHELAIEPWNLWNALRPRSDPEVIWPQPHSEISQ
jgi:hypothetical protein